jgi:hypothetical protein
MITWDNSNATLERPPKNPYIVSQRELLMGLLTEIQNDALSDCTPVATLLRKVMVLAANLDSEVLEDWVKHELHGYTSDAEVPPYRTFVMSFKINGQNRRWEMTRQSVPQILVNQILNDEDFHVFECRQPIGTINTEEIKASKGYLTIPLDNELLLLQGKLYDPSVSLTRFWGEVSASQVLGITDAVRSRVLDFILKLKKTYPHADDINGVIANSHQDKQAVTHIYNTTIHGGNVGPVGNNAGASITITVNQGDRVRLREELAKHGVDEADILELEAALVDEPTAKDAKSFGPKVAGWMGKMVGKAASGAWTVGVNVGTTVIQAALLGYYGLSN